jgi:hypothetical protein
VEKSLDDTLEEERVEKFYSTPCCSQACNKKIPRDLAISTRQTFMELPKYEQDILIKGELNCSRRTDLLTEVYKEEGAPQDAGRRAARERQRQDTLFLFRSLRICHSMFLFLHDLGTKRYINLVKDFDLNGLTPRVHKLTNRTPARTTRLYTQADIQSVVTFLLAFAAKFAVALPGRLPNFKDWRVLQLPSAFTKAVVHRKYVESCTLANTVPVHLKSFLKMWRQLCPYISPMKLATDLCDVCNLNMIAIRKSINSSDAEKKEMLDTAVGHLERAGVQRRFYQSEVERAKKSPKKSLMVLSFDYAQTVSYPSSPQAVGSIYFKAGRKLELFGIHNEGEGVQHTYIVDEDHHAGKGANEVISMLHDYLSNARQVDELVLFCDNTVGQNKNNALLHYLSWRIHTGLNKKISLNFLLVGHTKFAPDRVFGLIKLTLAKWVIDTMRDFIRCVVSASPGGHSLAVPTSNPVTKQTFVKWYTWDAYLRQFYKPLLKLTQYHHFNFSNDREGVQCKEFADSEIKIFNLMRQTPPPAKYPEEKPAERLSLERQWYLYENLRPLCTNPAKADHFIKKPAKALPKKRRQRKK